MYEQEEKLIEAFFALARLVVPVEDGRYSEVDPPYDPNEAAMEAEAPDDASETAKTPDAEGDASEAATEPGVEDRRKEVLMKETLTLKLQRLLAAASCFDQQFRDFVGFARAWNDYRGDVPLDEVMTAVPRELAEPAEKALHNFNRNTIALLGIIQELSALD